MEVTPPASVSPALSALILAPPSGAAHKQRIITGLTLAERGRRVAVRAGVLPERVHVVDSVAELERVRPQLLGGPLLFVRASDQVVAAPLVEPLEPESPGTRVAVDATGAYAGAIRAEGTQVAELLEALRADLAAGDRQLAASGSSVARVEVNRRARHPAVTDADVKAAIAWQWELVHKPMDGFMTRRLWRPLARPGTRLCLRLPFLTPNVISIGTMILGVIGCVIAAGPSYLDHLIGMTLLFVSAVGDNWDGEVARLRLESSKLGAWLDAIGDDVARVATLLGVGLHVAYRHPDLPLYGVTWAALAMTVVSMALVYWYCIFVIRSSNNQDYTKVLGIGPGVGDTSGKRSFGRWIGDIGAQAARRDFIDVFVFVWAIVGLPEVSFVGLTLGALVGLGVVLPTHIMIVRQRARSARSLRRETSSGASR